MIDPRREATIIELRTEIEQLRTEKDHWIVRCEEREAEIERLKAALREIADLPDVRSDEAMQIARAALEGKTTQDASDRATTSLDWRAALEGKP